MEATEICPLSREAVAKLLADRNDTEPYTSRKTRRRVSRWPFPGTVELWIPDENGLESHTLATSLDLSLSGVGLRCDTPLNVGLQLAIAIHEPEMSFHGRSVVRHCTSTGKDYIVGMEFMFDA